MLAYLISNKILIYGQTLTKQDVLQLYLHPLTS